MATYTPSYDLIKPDQEDFYNIDDHNANSDVIDAALQAHDADIETLNLRVADTEEAINEHADNLENPHGVTAEQVGAIPAEDKGAVGGVAELDEEGKVPLDQLPEISGNQVARQEDAPDSEEVLIWINPEEEGWTIDVTPESIGAIPLSQKGANGGVAELTALGKIPMNRLPDISPSGIGAIPFTEKGAVFGVAELDGSGKVPVDQLPAIGGQVFGSIEDAELWIEDNPTSATPGMMISIKDEEGQYYIAVINDEQEIVSVVEWNSIYGGPESSPEQIDTSVDFTEKFEETPEGLMYNGERLSFGSEIPEFYEASKVVGKLSVANFPDDVLNRLIEVVDEDERFSLTIASAQVGDTVLQKDNGVMYYVVDSTKLHQEAGYKEYAAGFAYEAASLGGIAAEDYATDVEVDVAIGDAIGILDDKVGGDISTAIAAHNIREDAHSAKFAAKADLVAGKIPLSQIPEEVGVGAVTQAELQEHNTSETAHADIRNTVSTKANLVDGKLPTSELPANVVMTSDLTAHNTSGSAHQDIRTTLSSKANLVGGKLASAELPTGVAMTSDITAHNASETAHSDIRTALTKKADLIDGVIPEEQLPEGVSGEDLIAHNVSSTAHLDIRATIANKADLVEGKVPQSQLTDVVTPHNTSETAHADIRNTLSIKADLVGGKVPEEQLPDGLTAEALLTHNTSETAHANRFATKADLVEGKVPQNQLTDVITPHDEDEDAHPFIQAKFADKADLVSGKVPTGQLPDSITPHNENEDAHPFILAALEDKADLVDGRIPDDQLPEGVSGQHLIDHNASPTAHADIRQTLTTKADLVEGKVPQNQLTDVITPHNTSATAHSDIRTALTTKADLESGKIKSSQLPTGFTINGLVAGDMTAHNTSLTSHPDLRQDLTFKADLVNGTVPLNQLPEGIGVVDVANHNLSLTAHPDIRDLIDGKAGLDEDGVLAADQVPAFLTDHFIDANAHKALFDGKADLVGGKVPQGQLTDVVTPHNTSETAHADIRNTLTLKADLVDGEVPQEQLPDVITPHDTSETAHEDIRNTLTVKADLVAGRVPESQLPIGIVIDEGDTGNIRDAVFTGLPQERWTAGVLPSAAAWSGMAFDGVRNYVVVAYNTNKAAYSDGGLVWNAATLPSTTTWLSVAFGDGKFVALAGTNGGAVSPDGIAWTPFAAIPGGYTWLPITYGNGKFVALARDSSKAMYSTNGTSWTVVDLPVHGGWQSITFAEGKFFSVSYTSGDIVYSEDGITWSQAYLPLSSTWRTVGYVRGRFVALAHGTKIGAYSEDGINWAQYELPKTANWVSSASGGGKMVAVATNGAVMYTKNGFDWVEVEKVAPGNWNVVIHDGIHFVLLRENSNVVNKLSLTDELVDYEGYYNGYVNMPNGIAGLDDSGKMSLRNLPPEVTSATDHLTDKSNPHEVTAAQVGAIPTIEKGVASGVATLGVDGKVVTGQLPEEPVVRQSAQPSKEDILIWIDPSETPGTVFITPQNIGAVAVTDKGVANGVASLGVDGKVPTEQLPVIAAGGSGASGQVVAGVDGILTVTGWADILQRLAALENGQVRKE